MIARKVSIDEQLGAVDAARVYFEQGAPRGMNWRAEAIDAAAQTLEWLWRNGDAFGAPLAALPVAEIEARLLALRQVAASASRRAALWERNALAATLGDVHVDLLWTKRNRDFIRESLSREAEESRTAAPGDGAAKKQKRAFADLPRATQAAMRCNELRFCKFLGVESAAAAADHVRRRCGVASRSTLDLDDAAGAIWRAIEGEYQAWVFGSYGGAR